MGKRSIQEWEKSVETLKNNCKRIISLSKSIRYVGVINEYGRTLSGTLKSGIKPMFSRQQVRDEFFAISSFMKLRSKPITAIGELNYILLNHQKVNSLVLSNKIITYYITFPKDTIPSEVLIKKISKVIMQA